MGRASEFINSEATLQRELKDTAYDAVKTINDNIEKVTKVADGIDDGTIVSSNQVLQEPLKSNINAVGGIASDVRSVADIASDVITVSGNTTEVTAVAGIATDVAKVGAIDAEVGVVAGIDTKVSDVAGIKDSVIAVGEVASKVAQVADIDSKVATVSDNIAIVRNVASIKDDVQNVSDIRDKITTVVDDRAMIQEVLDNKVNIDKVALADTIIEDVANHIDDIEVVSNNIVDINTTVINMNDINEVATNLEKGASSEILNAQMYAREAQLKMWEAEARRRTADEYATNPISKEVRIWHSDGDGTYTTQLSGEYSAVHWAAQNNVGEHALQKAENLADLPDLPTALVNLELDKVDNVADLDKPISTATQDALDLKENIANKNTANGYAGLDENGILLESLLPEVTKINKIGNYADIDTAINNADVQNSQQGDWFTVDTNGGYTYIVVNDKPTTVDDVAIVRTPTSDVTSVYGRTGDVVAETNDYTWDQIDKSVSDIADINNHSHTRLTDIGTNTHDDIDNHIASTDNPHSVTKDQVGLGTVTDDPQVKIASNLSDLDDASVSRTNLGVEIGKDVQAYDANIVSDGDYVHTDNNYVDGDKTKVDYISVTQDVDLDTIESDTNANNTHRSSDGTDHTYIDQDVRTTASPTFDSIVVTNTVDGRDVSADGEKLDYITVTDTTDLDAIRARVAELDAAVVLQGEWDASAGSFPTSTDAGQTWIVSTAGTVDDVEFEIGDRILATVDNASTDTYADNWLKLDYSDKVSSVFGRVGSVVATDNDYTWAQIDKSTSDIADIATKSHTSLTDIGTNTHSDIDDHIANVDNPHSVTKDQVGLGNCDNTSDADKPVSTATQEYVDNTRMAVGTDVKVRYDKRLSALDIIEMRNNDDDKLDTVRYDGDDDSSVYYRDVLSYDDDLHLIEVKHYYNTADLDTESGKTTLGYSDGKLNTASYSE